ncbi:MAG: 50S ribosomal protein L9 [Chloroflexi bacterium]|nr:50S ribosomal protein L9 [Chloroflexota bacterium]
MKVVLLQDIPRLGRPGDVKNVAEGYARNYLIPRGLAVLATDHELNRVDQIKKSAERKLAKEESELQAVADKINGASVTLQVKAGPGGTLYGSVTNADVAAELAKIAGYDLDKRRVELDEPLKEVGSHEVQVRLGPNRVVKVTVNIEGLS